MIPIKITDLCKIIINSDNEWDDEIKELATWTLKLRQYTVLIELERDELKEVNFNLNSIIESLNVDIME